MSESAATPRAIGDAERKTSGGTGHPPDPGREPTAGERMNAQTDWKRREGWEDSKIESAESLAETTNPPTHRPLERDLTGGTSGTGVPASSQQSPGTDGVTPPAAHTSQ